MRSMSIGAEPIAVTSLYPTPQTVSEGGFAQSLQDTVDAGSVTPVTEQQVQTGVPAESTPQQSVQDAAPQEAPQAAVPEATQSAPQDTTQSVTQSQLQTENAEQTDQTTVVPAQLAEAAGLDPELMKELADLLGKKEKMLTAPQRMQQMLESMIAQAFRELSDPEKQEEEFTEMVLDFLMEFIDRKFGGETEETSIFADSSEKDDDDNVQDVLLQAVVQMLDQIRSEDDQSETPETTEEEDAVEAIPATNMAKEYIGTTANQLLSEEAKQTVEMESFTEAPQTAAQEQPETAEAPAVEIPGKQEAEAPIYQAAKQTAEAIYTEVTQPQSERQTTVLPKLQDRHIQPIQRRPVERITEQPIERSQNPLRPIGRAGISLQPVNPNQTLAEPVEAAQPLEQLFGQFTVQTIEQAQPQAQIPALTLKQSQAQPVKAERSREAVTPYSLQPAEELEELTRAVKGGESVKPEQSQSQLDLSSQQQPETEPIKPAVTLEAAGEAVPFEAAIASTVPQITLTQGLADSGSGAERIVTQIVSEIFNQLPENGGTTTFVMTLNPESLGKVTVKLVEEAGKISVSVTAHEKRTAEILSQRFDTLQTAMKENGTQLEKYQVVYAPEKDEGAAHQNFDGSSKNPYVKQDDEESDGSGEFAELLQQAV